MGSGKSTLGYALGRATQLQYIDLDTYIERRFHASVSDIFANSGENGFRNLERRMLEEVSQFEDVIIACGGGTPCYFDNMAIMNAAGTTVWLKASEERLWQRLKMGRRRRPLIASLTDDELRAFIHTKLAERVPHYSQARHIFDADNLDTIPLIADSVQRFCSMLSLPLSDTPSSKT